MPLLFHLLLVAVSLAASDGEPIGTAGDTYNASMCPTSLTCGDGVDIHYPFYLSDESEVTSGIAYFYCGYPGMAIACVRGHPVLHLNNDSYNVLNIDYGNNTISLADTDALDGGSCPRVRHNVTIPPPLGHLMKLSSTATGYLAFFFNCTFTSANPPPLGVEPINCTGFDGGTGLSYALPQPDVPPGGWPRACKEAYVVPVLRDSLWGGVHNYSQSGEDGYGAVLKQGFRLTWDPSAGPCSECEQSQGQCSYNHTGGILGCLCSDGHVRNPDCVPPSKAQSDVYLRYSSCTPTPYQCGSVKFDIDYPFSVSGVNRPDYCSYPGYRLFCTNGTLVIYMSSAGFQVTNVDYDNHILTVIDQNLAQETCLQPYRNTTINDSMFMYTDRDQFLTVYINCSGKSLSLPLAYDLLSCLSGGRSYYRVDNGTSAPDVQGVCSSTLVVPYNSAMAGSLAIGNSSLGDAINGGFTVRWKVGMGWCGDCKHSGGLCGYTVSSPNDQTCYCPDEQAIGSCSSGLKKPWKWGGKRAIGIVSAFLGGIFLSLLLMCGHCGKKFHCVLSWKRGSKRTPSIESFLQKHETQHPKRYTYSEVKRMTRSFTHKLGQGGFGTVYKGNLTNGRQIAVKLLKSCKDDGQEFMNEVASISKTSHVNVVTLLGYCLQGSKRALIYEYMPNGSLERFTFGRNSEGENSLSSEKLFDIAVGVARGLEYLHRGCNTRIVHFDIKPQNVLLDQGFVPKISDFGLAKLCMQKESIISIDGARGTIGYIAPEVFSKQFGVASSKSDVYSYGMMILEMVGARKNVNVSADVSSIYFPQWVYEHLEEYCVNACNISVDTGELVRKMIIVGLWCIQLLPNNRPSMTRVVEMLESYADDLQIPPQSLLC